MIISTTGTLSQDDNFLVYHGPYAEIIPQMAEDGYQGVEMHILIRRRSIDRNCGAY